jgi:hypothetical protein
MKLDEDPFLVNMNMVELKGKEVVIGEERPLRMIKSKSPKDSQWRKNEGSKLQKCPKATFDIFMTKYKEGRVGIRERENWAI